MRCNIFAYAPAVKVMMVTLNCAFKYKHDRIVHSRKTLPHHHYRSSCRCNGAKIYHQSRRKITEGAHVGLINALPRLLATFGALGSLLFFFLRFSSAGGMFHCDCVCSGLYAGLIFDKPNMAKMIASFPVKPAERLRHRQRIDGIEVKCYLFWRRILLLFVDVKFKTKQLTKHRFFTVPKGNTVLKINQYRTNKASKHLRPLLDH